MTWKLTWPAWTERNATEADFDAVYRAALPRVFNFFRYRVGDDLLAEDLTGATFEKAWRSRERYRHDLGAFSTWLFTIARRVAIDHYRARRPEAPLSEAMDLPGEGSPEEVFQDRAEVERLRRLLVALPDREREVLALKFGAELSHRAIAELTGLKEGHIGVIVHRALQQLRAGWEHTP